MRECFHSGAETCGNVEKLFHLLRRGGPGIYTWGGNAACGVEHPLRGSRFVSERLQTPLRRLPFGGKVGLVEVIRRFSVQDTDSNPVCLFNPVP
jgi:hypothetical protein